MSAANKSAPAHPFMDREVLVNLTNGVNSTLKTMVELEAQFDKPFVSTTWAPPNEISVFLKLDSDPYKGVIYFHFDKTVAKNMIEKMTGSQIDPNSNDVLDGVGEISNIFYGATKTKLNELGFQLNMTTPHPYWTKDLPARVGNAIAMVIPFKISNLPCFIEIVLSL